MNALHKRHFKAAGRAHSLLLSHSAFGSIGKHGFATYNNRLLCQWVDDASLSFCLLIGRSLKGDKVHIISQNIRRPHDCIHGKKRRPFLPYVQRH